VPLTCIIVKILVFDEVSWLGVPASCLDDQAGEADGASNPLAGLMAQAESHEEWIPIISPQRSLTLHTA
jgi:hypothetical protein